MRRKKKSAVPFLGRIIDLFVALRERWASDIAARVEAENARQAELHRQFDAEHPSEQEV